MMNGKLRVGLAGAGMISHYHLTAWRSLDGAEIVALCDPDEKRARERARQFGVCRVYTDFSEMLESEAVDAVDIASPCETHAALIETAAAKGIDVLCQKPLTPTLLEAETLA